MELVHNILLIGLLTYCCIFVVLWYFRKAFCFKLIPKEWGGFVTFTTLMIVFSTGIDYIINGPGAYKHLYMNSFFAGIFVLALVISTLNRIRENIKGDF